MSAPGQQRSCPHRCEGEPPICQNCLASAQAVRGPTSSSPNEQGRFEQYRQDPTTQAQSRRDQNAFRNLPPLTSEETWVTGRDSANNFFRSGNPNDLATTYPYARNITELENIGANSPTPTPGTRPVVRQPASVRVQPTPPRRSSSNIPSTAFAPGRPAAPGTMQSQTRVVQNNYAYRRPPLKSITGTSSYNVRNSSEGANDEDNDEDDEEDSDNEE